MKKGNKIICSIISAVVILVIFVINITNIVFSIIDVQMQSGLSFLTLVITLIIAMVSALYYVVLNGITHIGTNDLNKMVEIGKSKKSLVILIISEVISISVALYIFVLKKDDFSFVCCIPIVANFILNLVFDCNFGVKQTINKYL